MFWNRSVVLILSMLVQLSANVLGQALWQVKKTPAAIQVDGFLQEWEGVEGLALQAGAPGVRAEGVSQTDDLSLTLKALWDKENLYLALDWKDNIWDIEQVPRQQAVWVTPQQQRRERMLFYDDLKVQINDSEFDYVLWVCPRIGNRGPFFWGRLLGGPKRMEKATSPPALTSRQQDGRATLEITFSWRELQTKPKPGKILPLTLLLADSDMPGKPLELKLQQLKSLVWYGSMKLVE